MMVGRPVLLRVSKSGKTSRGQARARGPPFERKERGSREVVRDVSFTIHENEILGVAGIEGMARQN